MTAHASPIHPATFWLLAAAMVLVVGGSLLASRIQTGNGSIAIAIEEVRIVAAPGQTLAGLLYVPENATATTPAPGVLAIHGYINSRETQSAFAIELARRGMVVLSLDQAGHGYSDPPAFANGFGGPAGLAWLRNQPQVDPNRIGMEGHSMGGWAVLSAAAAMPDGYAAMVLAGSSPETFGAPAGTPTFPRNLLLIYSRFDEFSAFMWGVPTAPEIVATDKLKRLFGTTDEVVVGRPYGNPAQGTARQLAMPAVTHAGDHLSPAAVGSAIDWLQSQLGAPRPLPATDQLWPWKELGTALALIGMFGLLFPCAELAFRVTGLRRASPDSAEGQPRDRSWLLAAILATAVPALTYFPLQTLGGLVATATASQMITNGIVVWMIANAALSLVLYARWRRRALAMWLPRVGGLPDWLRAIAATVITMAVLVLIASLVQGLLNTDFRFWVVALKVPSAMHYGQILMYMPAFVVFFLVLGMTLHGPLRVVGQDTASAMVTNSILLAVGFGALLALQYTPLFLGGTLAVAQMPLLTIVAFQFVPLLMLVGGLSSWCFARTGQLAPGAMLIGGFVCWYVVAGTATQAVPWFMAG